MKHNIGLVGCGNWGKKIIKEIQLNKNFTLAGVVCKSNIELIKNSRIKIYDNYEKMINDQNITCLFIAKNPNTNTNVLDTLSNNKPIIFEKPISENFETAARIYNHSISKKVCFMTNLPNIYSDTFKLTNDFLISNLSKINKIKIVEGGLGPFRKNIHPILDWGIHPLTYIIKIFGNDNFDKIFHKCLKEEKNNNIYISKFNIITNFKIDISILTGNFFKKKIRMLKIYLKDGSTFVNNFNEHEISYNQKIIFKSKKSPIQNLLNKFAENIEKNKYIDDSKNIFHSAQSIKIINDKI